MKANKSDWANTCMGGYCHQCRGWKLIIIGLIFLWNAYWPFLDIWKIIGFLLVLGGLGKLIMPCCPHCR